MKRSLAWLAGAVGIAALGRAISRRGPALPSPTPSFPPPAPAADAEDDPAAELRRTLAARRGAEAPASPTSRAPAEGPEEPTVSLEERRARIHAKAQEAIESMRAPGTDG